MLGCCAIPARAQVMLAVLLEPGDVVLAPIGGSGGGGFDARCPKGELLSGFDVRAADDVDSIAPLCSLQQPVGCSLIHRDMAVAEEARIRLSARTNARS